jgi:hypothetical protein
MSDPLHEDPTTAGTHGAAGGSIAPPDPPLTGTWQANDGGMYFLQQIADTLWWVGLSRAGSFYPGLHFCNVYRGTITANIVTGEWSDVPRGTTSNRGRMTLRSAQGQLLRDPATGDGFSASTWSRVGSSLWPVISANDLFPDTFKNVQKNSFLFDRGLETLADNLLFIRDSASVFGTITTGTDHETDPVIANYPWDQSRFYGTFICLNDSSSYGFRGFGNQDDGDVTFFFQIDGDQINVRQPRFFAGVDRLKRSKVQDKVSGPIEGEIIMYGRATGCDDGAEGSAPLLPGWAESAGSGVLFNGGPIRVITVRPGDEPVKSFLTELSYGDPVRVTGVVVFDLGHQDWNWFPPGYDPYSKLEIHPVYSVDRIASTFSNDLSGAWADDIGNTYYLRHDLTDNTVWYAGISPLGSEAFGQVFHGIFRPAPRVLGDSAVPPGTGGSAPVLPQDALTGNAVAISLGYGTSAPFETSGTRLGDTGAVTFALGSANLAGRNVPTLSMGEFRLMKLYDA